MMTEGVNKGSMNRGIELPVKEDARDQVLGCDLQLFGRCEIGIQALSIESVALILFVMRLHEFANC